MRFLVLHSSYDGQTGRIAEAIAAVLRAEGHDANVRPASTVGNSIPDCDAIAIGGAIRYGHHSPELERLVKSQRAMIAARPNAFFSVCLSAGGPGARPATARRYLDEFARATGWEPQLTASFAGALVYSRYVFFIRFMMRLIMLMAGGETDTTRDYEYTDWEAVERFARELGDRGLAAAAHP